MLGSRPCEEAVLTFERVGRAELADLGRVPVTLTSGRRRRCWVPPNRCQDTGVLAVMGGSQGSGW